MVSPLDGSITVQLWVSEHHEKGGEEWGGKTGEDDPLERTASPTVSSYVGVLAKVWSGMKGDLPTHLPVFHRSTPHSRPPLVLRRLGQMEGQMRIRIDGETQTVPR
jgi:hypothetical protein